MGARARVRMGLRRARVAMKPARVKAPRVACYVRVSSRTQTVRTQMDAIEQTARARGDSVALVYEETKSGKTITARPELARMRMDAHQGKIARLYVFRLDRLTRSGVKDTFEVIEELRKAGVELVSVTERFDFEGPGGQIILAVLAACAQMEIATLSERISAARDRIEREGGRWGRPSRVSAKLLKQAHTMATNGRTMSEIAVALKIPRATIGRHLKALVEVKA